MPRYDFRCNDCRKYVVLTFKTYADYDTEEKRCPLCNSLNVTRSIRRVGQLRSEISRFENMTEEAAIEQLANSDPQTLGRYMRRMSDEFGEDLGTEFNEVVDRLEKGQDPEEIEKALPPVQTAGGTPEDLDNDAFFNPTADVSADAVPAAVDSPAIADSE